MKFTSGARRTASPSASPLSSNTIWPSSLSSWATGLGGASVLHLPIALSALGESDKDTFFHLSDTGQLALAGTSALLGIASLMIVFFAQRRLRSTTILPRSRWICLAIGLSFTLFLLLILLALAPQVYYQLYQILIPELPQQWVIRPVATLTRIAGLLVFDGGHSFAALFTGMVVWAAVLGTIHIHVSGSAPDRR